MGDRHGDRQRKLSVWVTDYELQRVNDQARDIGITTAALVRSWIAGQTGPTAEAVQEGRELRRVLERALLELHREGNNINQVARAVNSGEDPGTEHIRILLREIRDNLTRIEKQINRIWEVV